MNTVEDQQDELETEEIAEPPSGAVKRSPGNMLRSQRETLELSVQQVAEKLNLTMHFIRCLEADSYDKLPGDVFVRGYIRTYSRLLRLDPDQVLMIYDEYNSNRMARKEEAIKRRNRRIKDRNRPWIIISGVAFVAVAVALWYVSPGVGGNDPAESGGDMDIVLESAASVLAASTNRVTPGPNEPAIDVVADVLRETSGAQAAVAQENDALMSAADNADGNALPVLPDVLPDETAQAQLVPQVPEHTDHHEDTHNAIVQDWNGTDELKLHFKKDSWVQVKHNGGEQELAEIRYNGETLVINGTAPFSVLLGDAREVELSFNGRQIDISSNIRADNTARLSIGM